jgi:multidrug efflux pump subunit AcrA (membrane-fusion protein)
VAISTGLTMVLTAACVDAARAEAVAQLSQDVTVATVGTVLSTVSGPGTLDAPPQVGVPLYGDPTQRQLQVKAGDHVVAGQELARTDDTQAKQAVQHANDLLNAARDQLAAAKRGNTTERREVDRIQIALALQDYCNVRLSLHQAEVRAHFDGPDQELLVELARRKVAANRWDVTVNHEVQASAQRFRTRTNTKTVSPKPTPPTTTTTLNATDQNRQERTDSITALRQRSAVAAAEYDLAQTEHQSASTRLADLQQIQTLRAQLITAWTNVRMARANRNFNEKHEVARAKAAISDARQQVKDSNALLAGIVTRAPSSGTVV